VVGSALEWSRNPVYYAGLRLSSSFADAVSFPAEGDQHWYFVMGQAIRDCAFASCRVLDGQWFFNLWPPGAGAWYAGLDVALPGKSWYVAAVIALEVTLWVVLMAVLVYRARSWVGLTLVVVSFTVMLGWSSVALWVFGANMLYSESMSTLGLAGAMLALGWRSRRRDIVPGLMAGISLAVGAYFRTAIDLIGITLVVLGIALVVTALAMVCVSSIRSRDKICLSPRFRRVMMRIVIASVAFMTVTLPWRAVVYTTIAPGTIFFSSNSSQTWANGWRPDTSILGVSGSNVLPKDSIWVAVGQNSFCRAYPERCSVIAKTELTSQAPYSGSGRLSIGDFRAAALEAIREDPLPWVEQRVTVGLQNLEGALVYGYFGKDIRLPGGILFAPILGAFVAVIVATRRRRIRITAANLAVGCLFGVTLVATSTPLLLGQFEPRYFIPILVAGAFATATIFASMTGPPRS
jgi:hypothetical protein